MAATKQTTKPKQPTKAKKTASPVKKVLPKPKRKRKTTKKAPPVKRIMSNSVGERKLTEAETEAIAKHDLAQMKKRKPWAKMTAAEKAQEVLRVNNKYAKNKPENAAPIPDADALTMKGRVPILTQQLEKK